MSASLTQHASIRARQRSIPADAVEFLLAYGTNARSRGADSVFFDHDARRRAARELAPARMRCIERYMNLYAIFGDDGNLVTLAQRSGRRRRA